LAASTLIILVSEMLKFKTSVFFQRTKPVTEIIECLKIFYFKKIKISSKNMSNFDLKSSFHAKKWPTFLGFQMENFQISRFLW
jgi:hypothetical protein